MCGGGQGVDIPIVNSRRSIRTLAFERIIEEVR